MAIATWSARCRSCFVVCCTLLAVGAFCASDAFAQVGRGGAGGGAGGGGGGSRGGGGRGGDSGEKPPKPKRNQQAAADPVAARTKLQDALTKSFSGGTGSVAFLANLFDQASTSVVPASVKSRKTLAEALAPLKGRKLDAPTAGAVAEAVASGVNADGIAPEELAGKKDPLKEALGTAGLSEEQVLAALQAYDQVVADQQNETIKALVTQFEEFQGEGQPSDEQKKSLEANLTALAGDAKPSEESLKKLSDDLAKAMDNSQLTNKEKSQLGFHLATLMNSPGAPPAQLQPIFADVRSILKAGLVKQADIQLVDKDIQAMTKSMSAPAAAQSTGN